MVKLLKHIFILSIVSLHVNSVAAIWVCSIPPSASVLYDNGSKRKKHQDTSTDDEPLVSKEQVMILYSGFDVLVKDGYITGYVKSNSRIDSVQAMVIIAAPYKVADIAKRIANKKDGVYRLRLVNSDFEVLDQVSKNHPAVGYVNDATIIPTTLKRCFTP